MGGIEMRAQPSAGAWPSTAQRVRCSAGRAGPIAGESHDRRPRRRAASRRWLTSTMTAATKRMRRVAAPKRNPARYWPRKHGELAVPAVNVGTCGIDSAAGDHGMVGHFAAAVSGQRPPQVVGSRPMRSINAGNGGPYADLMCLPMG